MGHPLLTTYLPFAAYKATTTCTTTPLPSLAGPGGAFDVPMQKCPPDGGSQDFVSGNPASKHIASTHSIQPDYFPTYPSRQNSPTCARNIPSRSLTPDSYGSTPPLTPDNDNDDDGNTSDDAASSIGEKDAFDFLMTVFPHSGAAAMPFAKSVDIRAPNLNATFEGVVLELPGQPKTLYVDAKNAESVSFRESIVALLDLADERLECEALVIVLERASPFLGNLLHSLMYVGGTVVTKPPFQVDPTFVLVGMEI